MDDNGRQWTTSTENDVDGDDVGGSEADVNRDVWVDARKKRGFP